MLQSEPIKSSQKKELKPLSVRVGGFLTRTKYILLTVVILLITISVELFQLTIDGDLTFRNITIPLVVVTFATYTGFFLFSDFGKSKGIKASDYINAKVRYDTVHDKIKEKGYNVSLKYFCNYKIKTERDEVMQMAFEDSTISYEDYKTIYRNKTREELEAMGLSNSDIKLIMHANKYKQPKLTAGMLWTTGTLRRQLKHISTSGSSKLTQKRIVKAARIALMSLFVVSISAATIMSWSWQILFEVISVLLNMYFGYRDGYESYAVLDALSYTSKAELLEEAYDWFEAGSLVKFIEQQP